MNNKEDYFVHSHALCESPSIGKNSRVWAFAHILPGARLGSECNVCDNVFIENDVFIGDRVTLKCGVQVWDGITIEDDVFVGPNATFTNDLFPRSKQYLQSHARTIIKRGASLGANCTILPGITIGMNAMIGAGAVVTRSVPPNAIVVGNPAKIVGYIDAKSATPDGEDHTLTLRPGMTATSVDHVTLHTMNEVSDIRGSLSHARFLSKPGDTFWSMTCRLRKPGVSMPTTYVISSLSLLKEVSMSWRTTVSIARNLF
jgi:acetyltransferase-like isoleucine patch superfamily enzyme